MWLLNTPTNQRLFPGCVAALFFFFLWHSFYPAVRNIEPHLYWKINDAQLVASSWCLWLLLCELLLLFFDDLLKFMILKRLSHFKFESRSRKVGAPANHFINLMYQNVTCRLSTLCRSLEGCERVWSWQDVVHFSLIPSADRLLTTTSQLVQQNFANFGSGSGSGYKALILFTG